MTEQPDRLDEFRDYRDELYGKNVAGPKDLIGIRLDALDWLIAEIERLRAEIERWRGLLRRLGWAESDCPACGEPGPGTVSPDIASGRHDPGCWLWREIRSI